MTGRMIAAGVGTTAMAATAALWFGVAQPGEPEDTRSDRAAMTAPAPGDEDEMVVCVGDDDKLIRTTLPAGGCPPGHKRVSLRPEEEEECPLCPPADGQEPDVSDNPALNDLERRIRALENAPYFEVIDDNEQPIFRVAPDGVRIFNRSGVAMAGFGAAQSGGYFSVSSGTALLEASLGAAGTKAGLQIVEDGLVRLTALAGEGSPPSLRIPSASGLIAGIGASTAGSGALLLGQLDGTLKASFSVPDGRGLLQLNSNANGGQVSLLGQSIGGGMFQIDNAQGNAAIKMGHLNNRYGIVLAGPTLGLPLVPKSGLPGSYFMGCGGQTPPSCVPNVP